MWSIDYVAKTEDEAKSIEADTEVDSVDRASTSLEAEQKTSQMSQGSEETRSESEVKSEDRSDDIEPCEREAAMKRVEELVKQMSLSRENEGRIHKIHATDISNIRSRR